MKKFFLFLLFCIDLVALELNELRSKLLHSNIEGHFKQEKKIANLPNIIRTNGYFSISDQTLLWETKSPIHNSIKITNDGIYVLDTNAAWKKKDNPYNKQFFLNIINLDFEQLKQNFDLSLSGDLSNWSIILSPIGAIFPKIFKEIQIYGDQHIRKLVLLEASGDITTIHFFDIKTK